jgi:hypothetical protein
MKFRLLIAGFVLALPAHAAVFKSASTPDQAAEDVQVSIIPGKPPQVINPQTGDVKSLPVKAASVREDAATSSVKE